jgi:hypothetical protein
MYDKVIETIEAYQKGGKQGLLELAKKRDEEFRKELIADLDRRSKARQPKPPQQEQ